LIARVLASGVGVMERHDVGHVCKFPSSTSQIERNELLLAADQEARMEATDIEKCVTPRHRGTCHKSEDAPGARHEWGAEWTPGHLGRQRIQHFMFTNEYSRIEECQSWMFV
jgi:hypothetical protein